MRNYFGITWVICASILSAVCQLNVVSRLSGKRYFGTATNEFQFEDAAYLAQLSNTLDFHQLTPANSMKWETTEPIQGLFNFTGGDMIVRQAERHGQFVRGHNCVWHSQLPQWVSTGTFNNATLLRYISFKIIVLRLSDITGVKSVRVSKNSLPATCDADYRVGGGASFGGKPLNEDGTFRTSIFFNTTGTSYIAAALFSARAADPHAKLYINDFNIEGVGLKSTGMYNLVKSLKEQGVPIDGIGVQGHLIVGQVPTTITENLRRFVSLGVEVAITELDIRMDLPPTDESLEQQRKDYVSVIAACRAVPECIGVTVWDWTDKYSWVPGSFPGEGAACPWDENFKKKPAYGGIIEGFLSR